MEIYDSPPPGRSRPLSARENGAVSRHGTSMGAGRSNGLMGAGRHNGDFRRYHEDRNFPRNGAGVGGGNYYRNQQNIPHHLNDNQFQMNPHGGPPPHMMAAAAAAAQRMARMGGVGFNGNGGGGAPPFVPPLGAPASMIHHHLPPHPPPHPPHPPPHPMPRGPIGGGGLSPPPRSRMPITKGDWIPLTKLGRLVKEMKIKSLEEVFLYDLPILEPEIFDHFLGITIKEEVLALVPTDKTLPTGERCVRFKALAVAGDCNGHVGLGVQISKEVAVAIAGASLAAKLNIIPIRRGFWGRPQAMTNQSLDRPHTLPCKVNGSFGSVTVRLVPAPRGSGSGSAPLVVQRILLLAGVEDAYFISHGPTLDLGFLCKATLNALRETFTHFQEEVFRITQATQHHLTPDMEDLLQQMDINVENNHGWSNSTDDLKNANRRLMLEAQIHRDLGLTPPEAGFDGPRSYDMGYNPLAMLHRGMKQQQQQQKFVPFSKRGPQLPPIPMRKRSLIPIVAPPPPPDDNDDVDAVEVENDSAILDARGESCARDAPAGSVCLSLRPRPANIEGDEGDGEDDGRRDSSSSNPDQAAAADPQLDSPWRSLVPAFKAVTTAAIKDDDVDAKARSGDLEETNRPITSAVAAVDNTSSGSDSVDAPSVSLEE